jgi:hypothetical protein
VGHKRCEPDAPFHYDYYIIMASSPLTGIRTNRCVVACRLTRIKQTCVSKDEINFTRTGNTSEFRVKSHLLRYIIIFPFFKKRENHSCNHRCRDRFYYSDVNLLCHIITLNFSFWIVSSVVEPLAVLGMAYFSYMCAELFHFSGIIR